MAKKRRNLAARLGHLRAMKDSAPSRNQAESGDFNPRDSEPQEDQTSAREPEPPRNADKSGKRDLRALRRAHKGARDHFGGLADSRNAEADKVESQNVESENENETVIPSQAALSEAGWFSPAEFVWRRSMIRKQNPADRTGLLNPEGLPLVYYDTETTGLSTGAGSVIFLIGFGFPEGDLLQVEQFFLADYPGEPAFLQAAAEYLNPDTLYVSYNGRSFDYYQLQQRFIMNGIPFQMGPQLDLLYPSRRLWKRRIGGCSLGDLEQKILSIHRKEDLPGREVPTRWFDFLRTDRLSLMDEVFAHHFEDICTLQVLHKTVQDILDSPDDYHHRIDSVRLAKWLLHLDESKGLALLEYLYRVLSLKTGTPNDFFPVSSGSTSYPSPEFTPVGDAQLELEGAMLLAKTYKRKKRFDSSQEIWQDLWDQFAPSLPNRESDQLKLLCGIGEELAKLLEHQQRDYGKALSVVEALLGHLTSVFPAEDQRNDQNTRYVKLIDSLNRRRTRLIRRCGN